MKKNNFYILGLILISIVSGSCKKYLDINQNPNAAETPPINGLLANVTYSTATNTYLIGYYTSYYVQYQSSSNAGSAFDTYDEVSSSASTAWGGIYDVLTNLHDLRQFAVDKGLNAYVGVSDILLALHLNMSANLWGNIPYSEAFQGVSNPTPKFDDQKVIYDSCIQLLDMGIAALQQPDAADEMDKPSDFIHQGNAAAWIKTAHALKARMLNQVSKTTQYDATKVLSELSSGYTTNGDDAQVTIFEVRNPWAGVAINNAGLDLDGWLSTYFVNATDGATYGVFDPRLPLIATRTKFGDYRGTPNGAGRIGNGISKEESYIGVDEWYSSTNSPLQIITNAECLFIKAEASFRNNDMATAYNSYIAGITAGMAKLSVPADSVAKYLANPAVSVGAASLTLKLIMKEKYVACFLMPVTWDDMRRFDYAYKGFTLPVNATLPTFIRRMDYPTTEISRNGANVPDASRADHLWWDMP
ncbi:MAG: SusD/RagB family nutrient-binding outer membrane lipoprotein [Ferruginibacter sp.]